MKRRQAKRQYWSGVVARFGRSGLSQAAFAKVEGVGEAIFRYWLYKLRREQPPEGSPASSEVRLIPVEVRRSPAPPQRIEVCVAGARLRIPVGIDPMYVAQVAIALKRAAC